LPATLLPLVLPVPLVCTLFARVASEESPRENAQVVGLDSLKWRYVHCRLGTLSKAGFAFQLRASHPLWRYFPTPSLIQTHHLGNTAISPNNAPQHRTTNTGRFRDSRHCLQRHVGEGLSPSPKQPRTQLQAVTHGTRPEPVIRPPCGSPITT
jgi:hypothetical protein